MFRRVSGLVYLAVYLAQSAFGDRRPNIICSNGHSVCTDCYTKLHDSNSPRCPSCRDQLLPAAIINRTLLDAIEYYVNSRDQVPEINAGETSVGADEINVGEITMSASPFAGGAYADVYDAKWHSQDVVVKVLRSIPDMEKYTKQFQMEANLAIGLHHPNIVRLFGTTKLSGNRLGIVMEKVDNGSLGRFIGKLDHLVAVSIALGVVDGLEYMHSRKVVHRDLKPANILLCGPQMSPKIADFGVSKVVQTILINTATLGTPKYTAPELMQSSDGHQYGCSADIYSLSIILFELFSGQLAEKDLGTTVLQIVMAVVVHGKRPKIPANFPPVLRSLVERGWDQDPKKRPSLAEFRCALQSMPQRTSGSRQVSEDRQVLMIQQSAEVARVSFPLPVMSLKWKTSCEVLNSQSLRLQMVTDIKDKSNMARIINDSVLSVLKVVPRHLFLEERRLGGIFNFIKGNSQQDVINAAYLYNKAIPATMNSNESAPEIIGTQLSLTEIVPGQSVLLVGIKGGYIQSLVAQLVGINGSVVTVTSDKDAMDVSRGRVEANCPLKQIVHWIHVDNVNNAASVVSTIQQQKKMFHTVIYCGTVAQFPKQLTAVLHTTGNVSIMAPVKADYSGTMRFQLYQRQGSTVEMRTITDFGVLFEKVH